MSAPGPLPQAGQRTKRGSKSRGLFDVVVREGDLAVLLVAALLLAFGALVRQRVSSESTAWHGHGVTLRHPKGWVVQQETPARVSITDLSGGTPFPARVTVKEEPLPALIDPALATEFYTVGLGRDLPLLHVIAQRPVVLAGGVAATRYDYAYAVDPALAVESTDVPVVVRAVDLVMVRDRALVTVGVAAQASDFDASPGRYEGVIDSVAAAGGGGVR